MFRKGGSAEGGITSGLQAPRQGYQGTGNASDQNVQKLNMDQNMADFLRNASIGDMKAAADQMYTPKERPNYAKRRLGDLMIDFGIDIASRTPTGDGISGAISTALAAAKDPFERFKASRGNEELLMQQQAENLEGRRSDMFKSLIEGQSDILAEKSGSGRFAAEAAAEELRRIIPRLTELKEKRSDETVNLTKEEQVTETMDQGPMAQSDNPISYDQLRARLPNQITDDIVELMANSAEALEDFAMISSQQDVDLFNQKYSVNLVLPSEA